ncbi:hypothetical protein V5799_008148 [Amblyomma americanum]|uniref:Uncharacterized protein n=1 Tax=Amblyomma americanum TaxID=6943 RepID=A0AAQ4FE43_AMBAM
MRENTRRMLLRHHVGRRRASKTALLIHAPPFVNRHAVARATRLSSLATNEKERGRRETGERRQQGGSRAQENLSVPVCSFTTSDFFEHRLHMAENLMKDVKKYADMDIDELLAKLSPEELEQLGNMVDPDDSLIPPSERCRTQTKKKPTGPLNRRHLLQFLEKFAREQEDWPEAKPFQAGTKRGKVFVPRVQPKPKQDDDVEVELDIGEDYEKALNTANESELVDLAAILGLHSMLSQDQYHNSVTNRRQRPGTGFDSLVKASMPKPMPMEPDNDTNTHQTADKVAANDPSLKTLNWNNIKNIRRDDFKKLFEGLKKNTNLESLSLANTDLTDSLVKRPMILGNKIEMEIARLVEKNRTLLRLGISFDVPDARMRVTQHLQNNYDRLRLRRNASSSTIAA